MTGSVAAEPADNTTIAPAAESASGNTTLIVQLTASDMDMESESPLTTAELKTQAERIQSAVVDQLSSLPDITVRTRFWITNAIVIDVDVDRVDLASIAAIESVERIEPETTVELTDTRATGKAMPAGGPDTESAPTGPSAGSAIPSATIQPATTETTYGLELHRVPEAWNTFETRGTGARIAVLDTGVNESHPDLDLASGGWAEFSLTGARVDSDPHDPNGHGTHVSSVTTGGNASGAAIGVAPEAELYHAKVFPGENRSTTATAVLAGLEWAVENDADVASLSFGTEESIPGFIEAIRNARAAGTVTVAASGNYGQGGSSSPGDVYDAIAVGAVNQDGTVASYSGGETIDTDQVWGTDAPEEWPNEYVVPDLTAAGVEVFGARSDGGYRRLSGTSVAAPYVAGTAGLLFSVDPSLSPATVETAIRSSTTPPEGATVPNDRYGYGLLDTYNATVAVRTGTVRGKIVNDAGTPVANVTIESDDGHTAVTDEAGKYELTLATGERELIASAFGYTTEVRNVTVEPTKRKTIDLTLDPTVDARLRTSQPSEATAGEPFPVSLEVAHARSLRIETTPESTVSMEYISINRHNETVSPGEKVSLKSTRFETVDFTIQTDHDAAGIVGFNTTVRDASETTSVSVVTGPTVIAAAPDIDRYRNDNGQITIQSLRAAISDFVDGKAELKVLRGVIDAFVDR